MTAIDKSLEIADAVALNTGAAGTAYLIGDSIPLSFVRDIGVGRPVYVVVTAATAIVAAGAGSISFNFITDTDSALGSPSVISTSGFTTTANNSTSNPAGKTMWVQAIPYGTAVPYEAHIGVSFTPFTSAITGGAVNVYLTLDPPKFTPTDSAVG